MHYRGTIGQRFKGARMKYWASLCTLLIGSASAWGYTFMEVGVASNIVVIDKKVHFAQGDGSLTILDLETGKVLLRKTDENYEGVLRNLDAGLLVVTYDKISLLEKGSLQKLWETRCSHDATIADGLLVSMNGNGRVEARSIKDGTVVWQYNLDGAPSVTVLNNRVLVTRTWQLPPVLALLDLKTGQELWKKDFPRVHEDYRAFLGDEVVYLKCSTYGQGTTIKRFDLTGKELPDLPIPEEPKASQDMAQEQYGRELREGATTKSSDISQDSPYSQWSQHEVGQLVFDYPRKQVFQKGKQPTMGYPEWAVNIKEYPVLPDGLVVSFHENIGNLPRTIKVRGKDFAWKGFLPYDPSLRQSRTEFAWTYADGSLIFGSSKGYVECVDATSGRSRWIYMFPSTNQTISSSRGHEGPHMDQRYKAFEDQLNRPDPGGLCILPEGKTLEKADFKAIAAAAPTTNVIRDPLADNPYKSYKIYIVVLYTLLTAIVGAFIGLFLFYRWTFGQYVIATFVTAIAIKILVFICEHISFIFMMAANSVILAMSGIVIYKTWKLRKKGWRVIQSVLWILLELILAVFLSYPLVPFLLILFYYHVIRAL